MVLVTLHESLPCHVGLWSNQRTWGISRTGSRVAQSQARAWWCPFRRLVLQLKVQNAHGSG